MLAVSHNDCDGVCSVAIFYKAMKTSRIPTYFTSVNGFKDTLCRAMVGRSLDELYVFDITGSRETVRIASAFSKTIWIDHHEWDVFAGCERVECFGNVKFVVERARSACELVGKYFNIESEIIELANQVDTNEIRCEDAEFLRDVVGAVKWKFSKNYVELNKKLRNLARDLAFNSLEELQTNQSLFNLVSEYREYLKTAEARILHKINVKDVNGLRIAIYESLDFVPVHLICNKLKEHELAPFDVIAVMFHRKDRLGRISTKLELRTHTNKEVIKIARMLKGGGHTIAAGATINRLFTGSQFEDLIKEIEL